MRLEELKLQKQAEKEEKVRVPHHRTVLLFHAENPIN